MKLNKDRQGEVTILRLSGRMILPEGSESLRRTFANSIDDGCRSFVLNLDQVTGMDSGSLGEIVACAKRARDEGGNMKLVLPERGRIHDLLRLTTLDRVLDTFLEEQKAISSFTE